MKKDQLPTKCARCQRPFYLRERKCGKKTGASKILSKRCQCQCEEIKLNPDRTINIPRYQIIKGKKIAHQCYQIDSLKDLLLIIWNHIPKNS